MSTDTNTSTAERNTAPLHARGKSQKPSLLKLPGLIAISLYMLLLSGSAIVSVAEGKYPPIYLIFAVLFITGALGLLLLFRWAWALTLAAVAILSGLSLWSYTSQHVVPALVQGLLNLIIFLYLVRGDVREKLK
jgi:uncharacterized membrane protein (DUF2068 family)